MKAHCHKCQTSCECLCTICNIKFPAEMKDTKTIKDGKIIILPRIKMNVKTDDKGNKRCTKCFTCNNCDIKRYDDVHQLKRKGYFYHNAELKFRWYCNNIKCCQTSKEDAYYLHTVKCRERKSKKFKKEYEKTPEGQLEKQQKEARKMEREQRIKKDRELRSQETSEERERRVLALKKERELADEDFKYDKGIRKPKFLAPKLYQLLCPNLFDLNEDIVINNLFISRMVSLYIWILYKDDRRRFATDRKHILGPGFRRLFSAEISKLNIDCSDVRLMDVSRIINHAQLDYNRIIREKYTNNGEVNKERFLHDLMKSSEKSMPYTASLWYYSKRILYKQTIDGFNNKIEEIMQEWWKNGFYPEDRKDYLDIYHPFLLSQISVKIIPIANSIEIPHGEIKEGDEFQDAIDCVVCFESFPGRLIKFLPCNHEATCEDCSTKLSTCPLCRARILTRHKRRSIKE